MATRGKELQLTNLQELSLGKALRWFREKKGITRSDLATRSNLTYQMIGHYETGKKKPSRERFKVICTLLEVSEEIVLNKAGEIALIDQRKDMAEMVTLGEQQMWGNIASIARDLNRIANCLEAAEARARRAEEAQTVFSSQPTESEVADAER